MAQIKDLKLTDTLLTADETRGLVCTLETSTQEKLDAKLDRGEVVNLDDLEVYNLTAPNLSAYRIFVTCELDPGRQKTNALYVTHEGVTTSGNDYPGGKYTFSSCQTDTDVVRFADIRNLSSGGVNPQIYSDIAGLKGDMTIVKGCVSELDQADKTFNSKLLSTSTLVNSLCARIDSLSSSAITSSIGKGLVNSGGSLQINIRSNHSGLEFASGAMYVNVSCSSHPQASNVLSNIATNINGQLVTVPATLSVAGAVRMPTDGTLCQVGDVAASGAGVTRYVGERLQSYYNKPELDSLLSNKLNQYYTKTEVDTAVQNVSVDLSDYCTKGEVDTHLEACYYDKSEVDSRLENIDPVVDLSNYYTKAQVDKAIRDQVFVEGTDNVVPHYHNPYTELHWSCEKDECNTYIKECSRVVIVYDAPNVIGDRSVALLSDAVNDDAVSIGYESVAGGVGSVVVGRGAASLCNHVTDSEPCNREDVEYTGNVAIGPYTTAAASCVILCGGVGNILAQGNVAIGRRASAHGAVGVAIGTHAVSITNGGVAIGYRAVASDTYPIIIGGGLDQHNADLLLDAGCPTYFGVNCTGDLFVRFGGQEHSVCLATDIGGSSGSVEGVVVSGGNVAVGTSATSEYCGVAVGYGAGNYATSGVAIGICAAVGCNGVADDAKEHAGAVALGCQARALWANAVSIGPSTWSCAVVIDESVLCSRGVGATAVGFGAKACAPSDVCSGYGAGIDIRGGGFSIKLTPAGIVFMRQNAGRETTEYVKIPWGNPSCITGGYGTWRDADGCSNLGV